ncbi:MAG: type I secretion system permease/ATPase [Alphaproteobacteria bacterium]|nr:type I secretion system permease/ATPase [Alphaproteobacteria bacterium]
MKKPDTNPVKDLQNRVASALPGSSHSKGAIEAALPESSGSNEPACADGDPLGLAIADIARHYGQAVVTETLTAGLALVGKRLPLEHAEEAAKRAGLQLAIEKRPLHRLDDAELPVVLLTKDNEPEILWAIGRDAKAKPETVSISLPGQSDRPIELPAAEVSKAASGRIISLTLISTAVDSRGEEAMEPSAKGWFLSAFRDSRRIYGEAIAATLAVNVLALAMPLFSMNVYDRVLPNAAETTLWALALGVGIAILFDFFIRTLRATAVDSASRRADAKLSALIYGRLLGAKLSTTPASTGVRANTLREFETLRDFFNSATLTAFGDLPFLVLFLGVLYIVAGPLVWVVVAAIPVLLGIGYLTQRALAKLIEEAFKEAAQKNAVATETVSGLETIKAAGAESWAALKWEGAVGEHIRTGIAIRHVSNLGQHTIHGIQTLVQVLIVVFGFYLVSAGNLTMGGLIAATILSGRALQPLSQAANLLARLNQARIAYRTLSEIVGSPQERGEGVRYLAKIDIKGDIKFEKVVFQYEPMTPPAVRGMDVTIGSGEHVAIVGGIGSGKTTALKLIQGLQQPSQGRLLIDGVSVGQIEPSLLRRQVGMALQDAALFHGTLRENIAMANPALRDDGLVAAARISGSLNWISRLPLGFDTPIRERGVGLSGGQRQSIVLARALCTDPQVLLLDEPTSEMDGRTEQQVIQALKDWSAGRTLVVVTHRPAVLDLCKRLIVMEQGVVMHDGPKDEVLAKLKAVTDEAKASRKQKEPASAQKRVTITRGSSPKKAKGGP